MIRMDRSSLYPTDMEDRKDIVFPERLEDSHSVLAATVSGIDLPPEQPSKSYLDDIIVVLHH